MAVMHAMLDTELDVEQAQEMPDLGRGADGGLAPAARRRCSIATVGGMP